MELECPRCGHRATAPAPGDYVCAECLRSGRTMRMVPRGLGARQTHLSELMLPASQIQVGDLVAVRSPFHPNHTDVRRVTERYEGSYYGRDRVRLVFNDGTDIDVDATQRFEVFRHEPVGGLSSARMVPRGREAVHEAAATHSPAEVERRMAELNRELARPRLERELAGRRSAQSSSRTAADLRPGDRFRFLNEPGPWTQALAVERHGGMLTVRTPERGWMVKPDTPVEIG